MRAGQLRHRVDVQQVTEAQDPATGAITPTWSLYASSLPASIVPISGAEILRSGAEQASTRVRIILRQGGLASGITPKMRVVHGGLYYNILEVVADPTLARQLTLLTETGLRHG